MRSKMLALPALVLALAGCAASPPIVFARVDGKPLDTPAMQQDLAVSKTVCNGEMAKADMGGTVIPMGGLAGLAQTMQRQEEAKTVGIGCMAQHGYVVVPPAAPAQTAAAS
jgi:hypothetical protein